MHDVQHLGRFGKKSRFEDDKRKGVQQSSAGSGVIIRLAGENDVIWVCEVCTCSGDSKLLHIDMIENVTNIYRGSQL